MAPFNVITASVWALISRPSGKCITFTAAVNVNTRLQTGSPPRSSNTYLAAQLDVHSGQRGSIKGKPLEFASAEEREQLGGRRNAAEGALHPNRPSRP